MLRATPIRLCEREAQAGSIALPRVEQIAHVLLRRYGVVFRKLLDREEGLPGKPRAV